jgi:type II secretory pathway pseudopilin PulG
MMNKANGGFMLLEAILTIVIVSICLTFIAQSLLTNFRAGVHFQETVRSLMATQNKLGLLLATNASDDQVGSSLQALEKPYDQFTASASTETLNDHLKNVDLKINWPLGQSQGHLDVRTIIYSPDEK